MKRLKSILLTYLAAPFVYACLRLLCASVRLSIRGGHVEEDIRLKGENGVITAWHSRLIFLPYYFSQVRKISHLMDVMVSPSDDGELVAQVSRLFRFNTTRGSSFKNRKASLRQLARSTKSGLWPGLITDGSRGPALVAQPGAVMLARLTGRPVIPLSVSFDRKWTLNSWDKLIIPKPFCKGVVIYGEPVYYSREGGAGELENKRKELEEILLRITAQADSFFEEQ